MLKKLKKFSQKKLRKIFQKINLLKRKNKKHQKLKLKK